jgi:hypothetical protein
MTTAVIPRALGRSASGGRRLALVLGATAVTAIALLAGAATASANDVTCEGFTRLDRTVPSENKVLYRFRCTDAIAGYSIFSIDELISFDPEGQVQDPLTGVALNNESYSCEGVIPSHGEVCNGKAGQGHVVQSSVESDNLPCSSTSNFFLVIADAKGAPAGVFELGRPRGCPHPRVVRHHRHKHHTHAHRSHR